MSGSYIALLTGFYVDNGPNLPLWNRLPTVAFWVLPSLVGFPLVVRAMARRRLTVFRRAAGGRRRSGAQPGSRMAGQVLAGTSSARSCWTRRSMSSRMRRTTSTGWPAGSSSSQSS
jgi:hypothetical protein